MSSVYQPKRKELAKVSVVSSDTYSKNRFNFKFVGSVNRNFSSFITTKRNSKTGKCTFIDDTSSLTKKSKNQIVNFFSKNENNRKSVVYLVLPKTISKKGVKK